MKDRLPNPRIFPVLKLTQHTIILLLLIPAVEETAKTSCVRLRPLPLLKFRSYGKIVTVCLMAFLLTIEICIVYLCIYV